MSDKGERADSCRELWESGRLVLVKPTPEAWRIFYELVREAEEAALRSMIRQTTPEDLDALERKLRP